MAARIHPTKSLLIATTIEILDEKLPGEIAVDEILEKSGISKGSLYHHFEDLQELVETAQIFRYSKWIDGSIDFLATYVATARTKKELRDALHTLTVVTQADERKDARAERAQALAACFNNPRMAKQMGDETQRLTDSIADVTEEVKNKGLFRPDVHAQALATFIQAYTLGKLVNDYNPTAVSEDDWNQFIMNIVDNTFLAQE